MNFKTSACFVKILWHLNCYINIEKKKKGQFMVKKKTDHTEKALQESERKFKNLAEKSVVGIYVIQDDVFKYVNAKLAEILGYKPEELIGKADPEKVVHPEDWPMVRDNIQNRISGKVESIHSEFRGIRKNGEIYYAEVYGSATVYEDKPAVIGTLLDITERKKTEQMLIEAEKRYRSIFENAVEGIFQATREGKILVVNPALSRMLGYESPEECLSNIWNIGHQHYVDPSARERLIRLLEEKGLVVGFECELYKKDRTKIWVSMNVRGVFDKEGRFLYQEGSIEDITAKKIAQDELRRLNEFNKAIIDNAPVAIFTLDRDGVFTSVNPALARLSGLNEKAEKKLIGFNWLKNPYTISSGLADYIKKGLSGEPFHLWDFPFVTYRGDRNLYMDFKGVPLFGKDGSVEGLLCIIEETTDRVKTRAKLMQEVKMATLGRLIAGVAHELNNPLATLVAYAELARSSVDSLIQNNLNQSELEELKACLDIVQEQAFRCKNAVRDLLNIPKKNGLEKTPIDINGLIEDIIESTIPDGSPIKITMELHPSLPCAIGDISAVRQVFTNVIKNAIDAVEDRSDAAITIRTFPLGRAISIEITDNGIGIPASIIEKVFEPFFTTKEVKKGIGLGLSLCKELLDEMGGAISVESTPRIGTTFFIKLPGEAI